ncbi:MAG: SPFH domain-containing protein [Alphaproteobacteria bacterium]|nr:SPFH domain-containing protein [Alphaproteobacteria bacterium]
MALIDHANFDFGGQKIFAYEYPERNLSSATQLNVRPGQEALLVLGGRIEMKFPPNGPRPYTLDSANLPIVRKLFGLPFGGSNPVLAAVWFINKADLVNMEIVTDTFLLKDPTKPQGFPAIAIANVGIKVEEGEPFFLKLVNGNPCFSESDMIKAIQGRVTRVISEKISQLVDQLGITVAEINSRLSIISQQSQNVCLQLIQDWGLQFVDFNVRITQDTSQEGLMMASGFGTDRESFERQRILDIQEKAINNLSGGGNGLLGAVLAMGMVNSMNSSSRQGGSYNQPQQMQPQQPQQQVNPNAHMVYCGNCGRKYDTNVSRFCPNCGKQYFPCPKCGSDNLNNSRRCVNCGTPLQTAPVASSFCSRCGAEVPNDSNFCPKCGNKIR